jgi:hypothetical protein
VGVKGGTVPAQARNLCLRQFIVRQAPRNP